MLNERKKKILQLIIEDYISTAEPVGSRTIARKYDLGLSPATIRNEMSDLELLGYLEQPHTSAGRVPSAQAYRLYVDSLVEPGTLTDNDRALINGWFSERRRSIDEIFQSTAKILSRMTKNVSMVLANRDAGACFRYMKFLPLDEHHAILCIVTDDAMWPTAWWKFLWECGRRSWTTWQDASADSGRQSAGEITEDLLQAVHTNIQMISCCSHRWYSPSARCVKNTSSKRFSWVVPSSCLTTGIPRRGACEESSGYPEEERVVRDLLKAGEDSGLKITIGSENKFTGIQDCSMVQATYRLNGQIVGTMAVLGPTRMEYGKVITVMDYLHKYLKTMFEQKPDNK